MNYLKGIGSLEDKAGIKVAINVCQTHDFKGKVLCLEKSKFGYFTNVSRKSDEELLEQWDKFVDDYAQKITKDLPSSVKHNVQRWISRIALEYLSYCRRQEALFGVRCSTMMNFLTEKDWTELGRLNEIKLAKRLVHNEYLTASQRFHIMCYYCLHVDSTFPMAPTLWELLSLEEKESILALNNADALSYVFGGSRSVLLSMIYFSGVQGLSFESVLWHRAIDLAIHLAIYLGNQFVLMSSWKCFPEAVKQSRIMKIAFKAFNEWERTERNRYLYGPHNNDWRRKLVSNKLSKLDDVRQYKLPFYSSDVLLFILSEMNDQQQLTFFHELFERKHTANILKVFLDWPYQEYFLPTVRKLWGILPPQKYADCLLTLAGKYGGYYYCKDPWSSMYWEGLYWMEDQFYDYRRILSKLWYETPKSYKCYVFSDKQPSNGHREIQNEGRILLPRLLQRCPFLEKDELLFKHFLCWVKFEERIKLMHSESGKEMCSFLALNGKWSFANWLLEECLNKNKIAAFKKQFIQSLCGLRLSIHLLNRNQEKLLSDLIDWSFELDEEKQKFKGNLLNKMEWVLGNKLLLRNNNISDVERMMNFCLPCDEEKNLFKLELIKYSCQCLLKCLAYKELDKNLAWCFDSIEKIRKFKEDMVTSESIIKVHSDFIFEDHWEFATSLYEWFDLSPQAIRKLKKNSVFSDYFVGRTLKFLEDDMVSIFPALSYCLIDPEAIITFKKKFDSFVLRFSCRRGRVNIVKKYLDDLYSVQINRMLIKASCAFLEGTHISISK